MGASPGIPFGSYVLLKRLARGGMAEVFLGRQQGLQGFDRLVAVKRVLPHLADSPEFIRMFFDEARLAAKLSHPNCVHIYEFGKVGEDYFIAMEYVHGVHAGQLIALAETEPLPPALIARLGADACAGLHYAHELRDESGRGLELVHRDVSPPNLLISYDGTTKLVDFGIAKAAITVEQTRPGVVKGKYAYMSPEQTIGSKLAGKSDVFSLAMVMWELLAGQVVVSRDDKVAAMKSIRDGQLPPIESVRPDVPRALSAALGMALHIDAARRASALDFKLALEEYIKTSPVLGSSIELGQWIQERFAWESPTGDREIDQLLTRATASAPPVVHSGQYGVLSGEIDSPTTFDPDRPTHMDDGGPVDVRFPDIAATIPTPPPLHDLEEATQITAGPPHLELRAATDFLPEAPRRPEIYSPITIAAATGQKLSGRILLDPHARFKRIGIAAGAALVIGVVVFAAVSGDSSATSAKPAAETAAASRPARAEPARAAVAETSATKPVAPPAPGLAGQDGQDGQRPRTAAAETGSIEVSVEPSGARVTLDEREGAGSPPRFAELSPGRHRLVVSQDGYVPIDRVVTIEPGLNKPLALSMLPAASVAAPVPGVGAHVAATPALTPPTAPPPDPLVRRPRRDDRPGQLIVRTIPYSVAWLGGRKLDTTPFTRELRPGRYVLTFRHPGHRAQTRTVWIRPGRKTKLSFQLK